MEKQAAAILAMHRRVLAMATAADTKLTEVEVIIQVHFPYVKFALITEPKFMIKLSKLAFTEVAQTQPFWHI